MRFIIISILLLISFTANASHVNPKELKCLTMNIYHEARNEPFAGQLAVFFVTLNRVDDERWPNTICEVVWQKNYSKRYHKWVAQFSWTNDGKYDTPYNKDKYEYIKNWVSFILKNKDVLDLSVIDPSYGATHYHATYVHPRWRKSLQKTAQIGSHIFYQ